MSSQPEVYLTKIGNDLLLNYGTNLRTLVPPSRRILVIGGGVTGLTTAWALLDAGYDVVIASEEWSTPNDNIHHDSQRWEWSNPSCGEQGNRWCMTTRRILEKLVAYLPAEEHGVRRPLADLFPDASIKTNPSQMKKMRRTVTVSGAQHSEHGLKLFMQHAFNQHAGAISSSIIGTPVIDTDHYMAWLRHVVATKNGHFVTARISGNLLEQEDRLLTKYGASALVNTTGLGAYETPANRAVAPLRDVHVIDSGLRFATLEEPLCVAHDDLHHTDGEVMFSVSQNDDDLSLGGPHNLALNLTIDRPVIQKMCRRCKNFIPGLSTAGHNAAPFTQDLQPIRDVLPNVRVGREERVRPDGRSSRIIHSYGQGDSGFSVSYGCAADVVQCLEALEADMPFSFHKNALERSRL